jgi:hypothetical protein
MSILKTDTTFATPSIEILHTLMSERLVLGRTMRGGRHGTKLVSVVMRTASAGAEVWRRNALVRVWGLLDADLLVGRLSRAAADGDEPEEA